MSEPSEPNERLIQLITTLLILALSWLSMQPEWKLKMYREFLLSKLHLAGEETAPIDHTYAVNNFRREISAYEHAERNASTRKKP